MAIQYYGTRPTLFTTTGGTGIPWVINPLGSPILATQTFPPGTTPATAGDGLHLYDLVSSQVPMALVTTFGHPIESIFPPNNAIITDVFFYTMLYVPVGLAAVGIFLSIFNVNASSKTSGSQFSALSNNISWHNSFNWGTVLAGDFPNSNKTFGTQLSNKPGTFITTFWEDVSLSGGVLTLQDAYVIIKCTTNLEPPHNPPRGRRWLRH